MSEIPVNPTTPALTSFHEGASVQGDGRASTNRFTEWLTGRLKERAQIWKQERLYNAERRQQRGRGKGGGKGQDEDESDDQGDGRRSKKKKKKGKTGGGEDPPVKA